MPPPVEPAQHPVTINNTSIIWLNVGQRLKSAVAKPVVDMMEETWKEECRSACAKPPYSPEVLSVMITIAAMTIPKYSLSSSSLSTALKFLPSRRKYNVKLIPNKNMNVVMMISAATLPYALMLAFMFEKPPVPAVENALIRES